jgi:hypothetical protein
MSGEEGGGALMLDVAPKKLATWLATLTPGLFDLTADGFGASNLTAAEAS